MTTLKKSARRVRLLFGPDAADGQASLPAPDDISAIALLGKTLFLATDEGAEIIRLVETAPGHFGLAEWLPLAAFFDGTHGPAVAPETEIDIEGLAIEDDCLWLTGSHAHARKKLKSKHEGADALARLTKIKADPARQFLGRLPLFEEAPGIFAPCPPGTADGKGRHAASLTLSGSETETASPLVGWLAKDLLIGPFVSLPAKENGLDIEGLAVAGQTLVLGLRAPVIGGLAVILSLTLSPSDALGLMVDKSASGHRYRRHLLALDGLGVRALKLYGEDLLILAGPAMAASGPFRLYRWRGALALLNDAAEGPVPKAAVTMVGRVPTDRLTGAPEALDILPDAGAGGALTVMVLTDGPAPKPASPEEPVAIDIHLFTVSEAAG